jgi:hypothetical protein
MTVGPRSAVTKTRLQNSTIHTTARWYCRGMSHEDAERNADQALRQAERDVMTERSFDLAKHQTNRAQAVAQIDSLAALAPDNSRLPEFRRRLDEMAVTAERFAVDAFRQSVDGFRRAAEREHTSLASAREQRPPSDVNPGHTATKLTEWMDKIRPLVDASRPLLTSPNGVAAIAEYDEWLAAQEQQLVELRLLADAFELFRLRAEVEGYGEIGFATALDSVERNFDSDPERVILAWDAVKKLVGAFQNPRFAAVPEIAKQLERHRELEQRVATELRPKLAQIRTEPLIRTATYTLDLLKRDTDNLDEDNVLQWRKKLRAELIPLQTEWAEEPNVQEFLRKCERAFRRSEEDLGKVVVREIQEAEAIVKPLVERLERGLALKSETRVREHAPRLRARLGGLAPFSEHQRVQLLQQRAVAALARIEAELGSDFAREVEQAEHVPHFEIDINSDTKVQAVLKQLNEALDTIREEYTKAQEEFEEGVDMVNGGVPYSVSGTVESASRTIIRFARRAEEIADELRAVDSSHPAVQEVESAVPKLVKRAQQWKARLEQRIEYANYIEQGRPYCEDADRSCKEAITAHPEHALYAWPEVLQKLGYAENPLNQAVEALPDDHDEADAWLAKLAAIRQEVTTRFPALCVTEAARRAIENDEYGVSRFADALREALPDAPENERIAAIVAGTADARVQAEAEIDAGGQLIRQRATEAADTQRSTYDEWAESQKPIVALAGSIVANIEQYQGKWIAGHASHLGRLLYDHTDELNGDIYQFDYDPRVRELLLLGMKRLDDLYQQMAEKVVAKHGISGVSTTTQHYPRDAHYLCEIVGTAMYTPLREIRDNYGRVLGTVQGDPYPVPRVVIRGVATTYFVIVPDHPPSLDSLDDEGLTG